MTNYSIAVNPQFNSIEISFSEKPSEQIREALKALKFRWHSVKRVWYGYSTEEAVKAAIEGKASTEKAATAVKAAAEKKNKYGVKLGDLFYSSWGYDQTNVNFFQVIEIVGASSVRVREVFPTMIEDKAVSWASSDRVYQNTKELLPPAPHSVFIKDQEHGDLKRLKSHAADGVSHPQFYLSSFTDAYLVEGDTIKTYESWYA